MSVSEDVQAENNIITDAPIMERERTHLNEAEHALIKELLRPGASIEAIIPEDAGAEELWKTLDACVRGLGLLEARITRLKPIIGRLLLIFERKPSLYKALGYDTYSEFMKRGVYETLGLHRTSAYEGKLVATQWPQIGPDRYAGKLGPKKINILNKFTNGKNSNAEAWLQTAESMSVHDLQAYVEQRGFISPGEANSAVITIYTNRSIAAKWKEFVGDGRIQSVCGSKSHDKILEALMQECFNEWLDRHEQQRAERIRGGQRVVQEAV